MADIIRPIEPFELTQGFGENPDSYARFGLKGHNGWDLKTKWPDTPKGFRNILSSWLETFYRQGNEGNDGFGIYFETVVQLTNTWKLTKAHCNSINTFHSTKEGENQAISDNTGNSTGSHLHLTVKKIKIINGVHQVQNYNNGYFGAVNPQIFFDELRAYKLANGKPIETGGLQMTIDENLFKKLVNGSATRKQVAEYLEISDPDNAQTPEFKRVIGGIKSTVTELNGKLEGEKVARVAAETEIKNREEQVIRLKTQVTEEQQAKNSLLTQLKKATLGTAELIKAYDGRIAEKQSLVTALAKEKGGLQIELEKAKTQLESCKSGNPIPSKNLLDLLIKFLRNLK